MTPLRKAGTAALVALVLSGGGIAPALASSSDWDGDGMSNTWETTYRLDPRHAGDAKADADRDGLTNLREYQSRTLPRDEDTDDDGQDDGDERTSRTSPRDADSDDDSRKDGDEDADGDRVANEDEDDATETCVSDDDDLDRDHVDDEDENELRLRTGDPDADDDRVPDGHEDKDRDGVQNEDEDDVAVDACSADRDGDGDDDEDEGDRYGTLSSYDPATGTIAVRSANGLAYSFRLAADVEIEFEEADGLDCESGDEEDERDDEEGGLTDLAPGLVIAELEFERGLVEEIEVLRTSC